MPARTIPPARADNPHHCAASALSHYIMSSAVWRNGGASRRELGKLPDGPEFKTWMTAALPAERSKPEWQQLYPQKSARRPRQNRQHHGRLQRLRQLDQHRQRRDRPKNLHQRYKQKWSSKHTGLNLCSTQDLRDFSVAKVFSQLKMSNPRISC